MKGKNTGYNKKEVSEKRGGKKSVGKQTPLTEQKPQTKLTIEEIKKRILRSFDTGELDEEAIEALKKLNQQNRAKLTEEGKDLLDKKLVDRRLYDSEYKGDILEDVIYLIARGADVNAKDDEGRTALHLAAFHNHPEIAELLLKYGANPNAQDKEGRTALHYAAYYNCTKIAELLLKYGAKPNIKVKDGVWEGRTALHLAARDDNTELAELLLKYGADPNIKDAYGWVPLHHAAYRDNTELAELLLKYGASPLIEDDRYGETALDIALRYANKEMVRIIKQKMKE